MIASPHSLPGRISRGAIQQRMPLPLQVVAVIPNLEIGDSMVADE